MGSTFKWLLVGFILTEFAFKASIRFFIFFYFIFFYEIFMILNPIIGYELKSSRYNIVADRAGGNGFTTCGTTHIFFWLS